MDEEQELLPWPEEGPEIISEFEMESRAGSPRPEPINF